MIEILIIIALLVVFFTNWKIFSPDTYKINVSSNDLIYSSDNSVPFTGKMMDTLSNKLIVSFEVVNGIKQGEYILLTMDGNFAIKGFMNKNKNDGNWEYYYEGGQLECTGNFKDDEPVDKWSWFYKNGQLKCEGKFINGKPDGLWRSYNEDGYLSKIINYKFGEVINSTYLSNPRRV